jgi:voltage-gated potassium channel Kch
MMALEMKNHIVVIGYSHLGERIIGYLKKNKIPYSIIEKNEERVDEFLRAGEPVVVDDATETDALIDANVPLAKAVIITTDNIEASLIVTKKVREMNTKCFIITRCFRDELTEVIESLGANEVISSSKNAFEDIARKLNI